jgi:hypothetical protein
MSFLCLFFYYIQLNEILFSIKHKYCQLSFHLITKFNPFESCRPLLDFVILIREIDENKFSPLQSLAILKIFVFLYYLPQNIYLHAFRASLFYNNYYYYKHILHRAYTLFSIQFHFVQFKVSAYKY